MTLGLLAAAMVAAFARAVLDQRVRQLQRAAGIGRSSTKEPVGAPSREAEPDTATGTESPRAAARRAEARARRWRLVFYLLATGTLLAAVLGW